MYVALLYFDKFLGPELFHSIPETPIENITNALKKLMDTSMRRQLFEYTLLAEQVKILHFPFEIPSPWARGKVETLMLAVVVEQNLKPQIFQDLMSEMVTKITQKPDAFMAFYPQQQDEDPKIKKVGDELRLMLADFHSKVNEAIENANIGNILVLGLSKVGKTTLLERMRTKTFNSGTKPTLATNVLDVVLGNYKMATIDVSGQKQLRKKWWAYTQRPDAVVFVVDMSDSPERLQETKEEFQSILTHKLPTATPFLILGNKCDLPPHPTKDFLVKLLEPENGHINYQIQLTSAKTGEGIVEGFKWIVQEFLKIA